MYANMYYMTEQTSKRVALITGSTSGIGKEAALLFGSHGYTTIISGRRQEHGEHVARQINDAQGEAYFFAADLTRAGVATDLANFAISKGELAVLVNCVGGNKPGTSLEDQFKINYTAPRAVAEAALAHMASGACVVTVSSICAESGIHARAGGTYADAKAALTNYAHGLVRPLALRGIRAHIVAPGLTDTADTAHIESKYRSEHVSQMPLSPDYLSPTQVAQVIYDVTTWRQATGQTIVIDGGMTAVTG